MFTKFSIKTVINSLDLKDPYELMMGGSLAMRGIRPTNDIDLWVSPNDFERLRKSYGITKVLNTNLGDRKFVINSELGEIEVFEKEKISEDLDIIDGIYCQTIGNIIKLKKYFNREKDLRDISLIEEWETKN